MSAALHGDLDSFKLPDVLNFLNGTRKTGMLTLTNAGREAYVFFREGNVVYAASNDESLRLGPMLIRKRKLSTIQAEEIDDLMLRSGGSWRDIAVQSGTFSATQIDELLKVQVSEVIYDAFVWKGGAFGFYDGIDLPANAVTISIDLPNLIMEGARRINEWEECLRLLPDSGVVFRVVSSPDTEKITLSLDEWRVLFMINGQRTLEDLCRETETEAFQVYRLVYGLLSNKLIENSAAPEADETQRQPFRSGVDDVTVVDAADDTKLLVSEEATHAYQDVVKKTIAQITVSNGDQAGLAVPLLDGEYRLGRHHENDIHLTDLGVSAQHARIFLGPDGYAIEDLKSRNGTWVNGERITTAVLRNGDRIRLGATDLSYGVLFDLTR